MATLMDSPHEEPGEPSLSDLPQHTVTALSRWSILTKDLPLVESIKSLHVYDFDNTLFKTPTPNASLWTAQTIGTLHTQDMFVNGGWWHDPRILAATGEGADLEEPRAWAGWWNETIVDLVRLSMHQEDVLCVLLTGRSEAGYRGLISRIVRSRELDFDVIGLKPNVSPTKRRFDSTMHFKQLFLETLMETYPRAKDIRIYEDRQKHVKGFRDFFAEYNRRLLDRLLAGAGAPSRSPISAEVVHVAEITAFLDPVLEVAHVQRMVDEHNAAVAANPGGTARPGAKNRFASKRLMIKKTVFFTGYMFTPADAPKLLRLARAQIPPGIPEADLKFYANGVTICPRPAPPSILEKVGGTGTPMRWKVTGTGCFANSVWAARLSPVPASTRYHTEQRLPLAVLAVRKGARSYDAGKIRDWQPVAPEDAHVVDSVVGEKMILNVELENPRADAYEGLVMHKASKRKHSAGGDDGPRKGPHTSADHGGPSPVSSFPSRDSVLHSSVSSAHSSPRHGGVRIGQSAHRGGGVGGGRGAIKGGGTPRGPFRQQNGHRGGNRGGGGGGPGNGVFHYRSLDDVEPQGQQGTPVNYDDGHPAPPLGPQGWNPPQGPQGIRRHAVGDGTGGAVVSLEDYY